MTDARVPIRKGCAVTYTERIAKGRNYRRYQPMDTVRTPRGLFALLESEFHFNIDLASLPDNALCSRYFTPLEDALSQSWSGERCWLNPPYSDLEPWMRKAHQESENGALVVALIPVRSDRDWWHEYVLGHEIRFVRGRVRYDGQPTTAPFPSCIVVFQSYPPSTLIVNQEVDKNVDNPLANEQHS